MPVIQPLAGSPAAPQQHKQPSRKGRKAWRKNVDVSEVEKGLEERNKEIIKGGVVKQRASTDLFQVADEADVEIAKQLPRKFKKVLKADEIISQRSAVPAVSLRKRPGDNNNLTDGVLEAKRQRTTYVSHKELVRLRKVADGHHDSTVVIKQADYDPWAAQDTTVETAHGKEGQFSFLPKPSKVKAPNTLHQKPISLAVSGKPVPAVVKPKGAISYNPSFGEYEARLTEEGNKAVDAERKRLDEEEAERVRAEAVARSAAEAEEAERRAELSEWDEESAWEGFESAVEEVPSKRPKRKTPEQRNRIKRRKAAEAQKKQDEFNRRKQEQVKRLEAILAEDKAAREQALLAATAAPSSDESDGDNEEGDVDDSVLRRRQLGKFRLPEKDLELVLPDELQESLRLLKPEGNLLKDRYRSLVVRGKMETRRKRPFHKLARTKVTEKWAHKDFHLF